MDRTNPLGTIKDLTTGTLSRGIMLPARLAARSFGVARGAVSVGKHVAHDVTRRGSSATAATAPTGPTEPAEAAEKAQPVDTSEPVNVVEELGLDPAPVDEPAGGTTDGDEPVTTIDAQADPEAVDVTPADVADQIGNRPGAE